MWLTDYYISKPNVILITWDSTADANYKGKLNRGKLRFYLYCNCGSRAWAYLAYRKTPYNNVVLANTTESI